MDFRVQGRASYISFVRTGSFIRLVSKQEGLHHFGVWVCLFVPEERVEEERSKAPNSHTHNWLEEIC